MFSKQREIRLPKSRISLGSCLFCSCFYCQIACFVSTSIMSANSRKNKRGDRGSSSGSAENSAKKPNMKETEEEGIFGDEDSSEEEPTLLEIKLMLSSIQSSITSISSENVKFREDMEELKKSLRSNERELKELKASLDKANKQNALLQKELLGTKTKLNEQTERIDSLIESLDNLEQYSRKNSLEIHGIPENIYTSTEEVVLKVAEAVNVPVAAEDIEISHKLRRRNGMKPIIVKFCSHKVKSRLYKERTKLKSVKISDLYPSYASAATKQNRIFINENLTPYRADLVRQANDMKADGLLSSVWTLDGKVFVKTSPSGNPVRIYSEDDLDEL